VKSLGSCAIALTGADCGAMLNGKTVVPVNKVVQLKADDVLEMDMPTDGFRSYLCVEGGVDVPEVLGSRATDIRGSMGGFLGRALGKGDTIGRLLSGAKPTPSKSVYDPLRMGVTEGSRTWELRVIPGPGHPSTTDAVVKARHFSALCEAKLEVSKRADRMAVVLNQEGKAEADAAAQLIKDTAHIPYCLSEYKMPELVMKGLDPPLEGGEQMSEGTASGTIQLPPDGNPVILLAEHQTTGGYKVPAVVIQADMWKVGQMKPGDKVRLAETTAADAIAALEQLHKQAVEITAA